MGEKITSEDFEENNKRKHNIRIYKIYEVLAWDFLFHYSVIYLIYLNQKFLNNVEILLIEAVFIFSKVFFQIFVQIEVNKRGKRNSLIIGNFFLLISLVSILISKSYGVIFLASLFMGIGFDIKELCESNLLYDSIKKNHHRGITFTKIESKVNAYFYIVDAISSILAGFLYVINPYIPLLLSIVIVAINILLSFQFKEIKKIEKKDIFKKELNKLINSVKSIKKSKRIWSLILLNSLFIGMHSVYVTMRNVLLIKVGVKEEFFGIILAIGTITAVKTTKHSLEIHEKYRNKALMNIVLPYAIVFLFSGIILFINISIYIKIVLSIFFIGITFGCKGPYHVLMKKYLKNFTNNENRISISSTKAFVENIVSTIFLVVVAFLTKLVGDNYSILISGGFFVISFIIAFFESKKYVGKRPEEYTKEDLLE